MLVYKDMEVDVGTKLPEQSKALQMSSPFFELLISYRNQMFCLHIKSLLPEEDVHAIKDACPFKTKVRRCELMEFISIHVDHVKKDFSSSQYFLPYMLTKHCHIMLCLFSPFKWDMWVTEQDTSFCYLKCVGSVIKAISTQTGSENNGYCVLLTFKRTILCTKSTFISDKDYPFKGIMHQVGFHSDHYLPVKSAIEGMQSTGELHKLECTQGLSKQMGELLVYLIIVEVYYGNLNQQ